MGRHSLGWSPNLYPPRNPPNRMKATIMSKPVLTIERLRSVLDYDPETGIFVWSKRISLNTHVGDVAGSITEDGYLMIGIDGRCYPAGRLAWAHFYGEFPPKELMVDHRDTNRLNNRIDNLRLATNSQNQANRGLPSTNTTGYKGVTYDRKRKKYYASIGSGVRSRPIRLGQFNDPLTAHLAYKAAAIVKYGEFARFA
jgi:hypothetical protein